MPTTPRAQATLGAFGSILFPVLVFVVVSRFAGGGLTPGSLSTAGFLRVGLPVFAQELDFDEMTHGIPRRGSAHRHRHGDAPLPLLHSRGSASCVWVMPN